MHSSGGTRHAPAAVEGCTIPKLRHKISVGWCIHGKVWSRLVLEGIAAVHELRVVDRGIHFPNQNAIRRSRMARGCIVIGCIRNSGSWGSYQRSSSWGSNKRSCPWASNKRSCSWASNERSCSWGSNERFRRHCRHTCLTAALHVGFGNRRGPRSSTTGSMHFRELTRRFWRAEGPGICQRI